MSKEHAEEMIDKLRKGKSPHSRKTTGKTSRVNRTTNIYYAKLGPKTLQEQKRPVHYSNYSKRLHRASKGENHETFRIKNDAKIVIDRMMLSWIRRLGKRCKVICNQEGLSKIREKNVYTQIRTSYPPSAQKEIISDCQRHLTAYIASKVEKEKQRTNDATASNDNNNSNNAEKVLVGFV